MKIIRVGLHSLALVMTDIAGVGGGALAAFWILGIANQVWLQLPIAVLLSVGFFYAWMFSLRVLGIRRLLPVDPGELVGCWGAALLWGPVVFVPLHYFSQGYLTSAGNLLALALYQLPVNALALFGLWIIQRLSPGGSLQQRDPASGGQCFR